MNKTHTCVPGFRRSLDPIPKRKCCNFRRPCGVAITRDRPETGKEFDFPRHNHLVVKICPDTHPESHLVGRSHPRRLFARPPNNDRHHYRDRTSSDRSLMFEMDIYQSHRTAGSGTGLFLSPRSIKKAQISLAAAADTSPPRPCSSSRLWGHVASRWKAIWQRAWRAAPSSFRLLRSTRNVLCCRAELSQRGSMPNSSPVVRTASTVRQTSNCIPLRAIGRRTATNR